MTKKRKLPTRKPNVDILGKPSKEYEVPQRPKPIVTIALNKKEESEKVLKWLIRKLGERLK